MTEAIFDHDDKRYLDLDAIDSHRWLILAEIACERMSQEIEGFDASYDDNRGGSAYLASLPTRYLMDYLRTDNRKKLVQAAAIAVAAIEAHDRDKDNADD